jgi:dUTP pyrophosphatase
MTEKRKPAQRAQGTAQRAQATAQNVTVKIRTAHEGIRLPEYATEGSSGFDLRASEPVKIHPNEVMAVPTGLYVEIPAGYEMQIRPRSGLSKERIFVANSPGTVDSDYRGEVKILLVNHGLFTFKAEAGDRIAQGVVAPVIRVEFEHVGELGKTKRGAGGFGSTGMK